MRDPGDVSMADRLDDRCKEIGRILDRVDDEAARAHLNLAISHLEQVARWDRNRRDEGMEA